MSEQTIQTGAHDRLIRRLETIRRLDEDDRQDVRGLTMAVRAVAPAQDIVREGDRPHHCCVVIEGFVTRYKILPNGRRQILAFHIPGDMPDLQSLHLGQMDHSLGTITPSEIAFIPHAEIKALLQRSPNLSAALWRDSLIDASIFREWIVNVGARSATRRISHLFCELFIRLKVVGLTDQNSFVSPMTQGDIGEAMGLSTVHVNRTIQYLRGAQLIALRDKRLYILDWPGLQREAMFDPAYLHLVTPSDGPK